MTIPNSSKNRRILLAYSGGMDSTYLLWKLLRDGHEVVDTVTFLTEGYDASLLRDDIDRDYYYDIKMNARNYAEVVPALLYWFADHGMPIKRHYIINSDQPKPWEAPTSNWIRSLGPQLMESYDVFMTGRTLDKFGFDETKRLEQVKEACLMWNDTPCEFPLIDQRLTRVHGLAELPKDLIDLTLSCEWPVRRIHPLEGRLRNCGVCYKCKENSLLARAVELDCMDIAKVSEHYLSSIKGRAPTSRGQSTPADRKVVVFPDLSGFKRRP